MIQREDGKFRLPGLDRHAHKRVISFYMSYDKPCGELAIAIGENCFKIVSDNSYSVAMFLRKQPDIDLARPKRRNSLLK